jgi:long-chain fatty acid transport protein
MRRTALVALAATLGGTTADAGGLGRPNPISARGVGFGGAFAALADDVTALHFNPGALAYVPSEITIGGELVVAPRRYTPRLTDGTDGPDQKTTPIVPLPALGVVGRFGENPFTLGVGVWNTFGGKVSYEPTGASALDAVQDAVVEVVPGFAYRFDDRFAAGAALRIGIGIFSLGATALPQDADLHALGIGLSYSAGFVATPVPAVRIGLTYRAPLTIRTSGTGTVVYPEPMGPTEADVEHTQRWPQQLSLGVGFRPAPKLRFAAQLDWAGWSRVDVIAVQFPDSPAIDQRYPVDWDDNWSVRVGAEAVVGTALALRAGTYFDSSAVPDRTIERHYLDDNKFGIAGGASLTLRKWRIDAALDVVLPGARRVDDNRMEVGPWPERGNIAPGVHAGSVFSLAFAVSRGL